MKQWKIAEFGLIEEKISFFENKIQNFDTIANDRNLESHEIYERREAQFELWQWLKCKDTYWAQQSRAKWIKEGDRNTKYFHVMASIRQRKNCIEALCFRGRIIDDPEELRDASVSFFGSLFAEEHSTRPSFDSLEFKRLSEEQGNFLTAPFTMADIEEAVCSCDGSKASGPDGYNFKFFKSGWDIIKDDIFGIVQKFWSTAKLSKGSNTTFIALIPKLEIPNGFNDFRPISMVGVTYKIISKLLAQRLQQVMNHLIGPHQSSFIKGRQILDGALIADESLNRVKDTISKPISSNWISKRPLIVSHGDF